MFICQAGMHNKVQGHRNANVCKQTYDASCKLAEALLLVTILAVLTRHCTIVTTVQLESKHASACPIRSRSQV